LRRILLILIVLILTAPGAFGGSEPSGNDDTVARIGSRVVTREEFERQFERQSPKPVGSADSLRKQFLESLIRKELLVLEAKERGLMTNDPSMDEAVATFREDLLRAWMRQEEARIDSTVTRGQIETAFNRSRREFRIRHLMHWSRTGADSARRRIAAGEDFAAVAAQVSLDRKSAEEGGLWPWINDLKLTREFRRVIDHLPLGKLSQPFESPLGWHIVRVEERRQRQEADLEGEREEIRKDILDERSQERHYDFMREYRKRYALEVDHAALDATAAEAERVFRGALADTTSREALSWRWTPADSNRVLARYRGGVITALDYRQTVAHIRPKRLFQQLVAPIPLADIRDIFYRRIRVVEARRRGFEKDPELRRRLVLKREELATDKLYSEVVLGKMAFTEAEERAYYDAHRNQFRKGERFRYRFLQVDDASMVRPLVEAMTGITAERFDSLRTRIEATGHLRDSARDTGFREPSMCGAVAAAARTMKPLEVGHVVEADGLHTVFVILAYEPEAQESFTEAREQVRRALSHLQSEKRLSELLKDLEGKFGVERYPERVVQRG
jgi:hypothetical protein